MPPVNSEIPRTVRFSNITGSINTLSFKTRDERDSVHEEYQELIDAAKRYAINVVGIDSKGCKQRSLE